MKAILTVFVLLVSMVAFGQGKPAAASSGSCFKEWYSLFKERGANPIPDGPNDVIITVRNGDYNDCFMGRIEVTGGKISSKLQVQKVDGSYEEFDKKVSDAYRNPEGTLKEELREVVNGMSASVTTTDGEYIRLFFFRSLADKPKANKKAPAPAALIKN